MLWVLWVLWLLWLLWLLCPLTPRLPPPPPPPTRTDHRKAAGRWHGLNTAVVATPPWTCFAGPGAGGCTCERIEVWQYPGMPAPNAFIRVRRTCTFVTGVAGCPPVPAWAPGIAAPPGTLVPVCTITWHETWP